MKYKLLKFVIPTTNANEKESSHHTIDLQLSQNKYVLKKIFVIIYLKYNDILFAVKNKHNIIIYPNRTYILFLLG